jgi:hypothetical protein
MTDSIEKLTALFRKLGAPDPESWARSQAMEGINQLHRYTFLRQAWALILKDGDTAWIDAWIAAGERDVDGPFAGVGHALKRLLSSGADRNALTEVVRGLQAELLFGFCYLLDDPAIEEEELAQIGWALVETDGDYAPTNRTIGGLHESVLELDPSGREMRPKTVP